MNSDKFPLGRAVYQFIGTCCLIASAYMVYMGTSWWAVFGATTLGLAMFIAASDAKKQ